MKLNVFQVDMTERPLGFLQSLTGASINTPALKESLVLLLQQVPPRLELGSLDSKSRVLTITP